jgi:hypothetical protein
MFGKMTLGLAGLMLGTVPMVASAHPHFDFDVAVGEPAPPPVVVVAPPPVDRVWIEPVYRTVTDRVWRDAQTEDRCVRVWVADTVQDQVIVHGRHEHIEQVFVPGHFEDRHEAVVVAPGHWEDVQRQELVTPGHWADCDARVVEVAPRPDGFSAFFGHFRF